MKLYVCISLDVEEEGLFSGNYKAIDMSVDNVGRLKLLAPLYNEFGFPLTLFCAYSVFADKRAVESVLWMRDNCGCEIGAHLHHWSTPPVYKEQSSPPTRTHLLDTDLLRKRLATLLAAGRDVTGGPLTSFRMGRWDLKKAILPLLAEAGILVDSSICPLRIFPDGPDHFLAPPDPYWVKLESGGRILEAPVTQLSISRLLATFWRKAVPAAFCDYYHFFGALSANPLWHGSYVMRAAARLHMLRGGAVLNFFWHSSEMMPGGSPHVPDEAAAERLIEKIYNFCKWLKENYDVIPVTMTGLAKAPIEFPIKDIWRNEPGDW